MNTEYGTELIKNVISAILTNDENSNIILSQVWNSENRHIIVNCCSDWYLEGEHNEDTLRRILEIAQHVRGLLFFLESKKFLFVMDLACLASRKKFLNMQVWLPGMLKSRGERFVSALINYLQYHCPQIASENFVYSYQMPKVVHLPQNIISIILKCFQDCLDTASICSSIRISEMSDNYNRLLNMNRQQFIGFPIQQQLPIVIPIQFPPPPLPPLFAAKQYQGLDSVFCDEQEMFDVTNVGAVSSSDFLEEVTRNVPELNLTDSHNDNFNFSNAVENVIVTSALQSRSLSAPLSTYNEVVTMPISNPPTNINNSTDLIRPIPSSVQTDLALTASDISELAGSYSEQVRAEADNFFTKLFNHPPHPHLIDDSLDILQRFKDSVCRQDQDVYHCILRYIFDEYKSVAEYSEDDLQISAELFGSIVNRNLVSSSAVHRLALANVLDALCKPNTSKIYYFGILALDSFKTFLYKSELYSQVLRFTPHYKLFPDHLISYVENGCLGLLPKNEPLSPGSNFLMTSMINASKLPTNRSEISSEDIVIIPPDHIKDKIRFIFNNLNHLNLQQKCSEINDIVTKPYWAWFSKYLVVERVSVESNFHKLYAKLLDALKNNGILRLVTNETLRNIRIILHSDKKAENFTDRSFLKNLGNWLGIITLGCNRPLLFYDLDLRSLLYEAYHKGHNELLYVIPFVAKILKSCAISKIFRPPNIWTMAMINIFAELFGLISKLNLKFEIEVLCKDLNISLSELEPRVFLEDPQRTLVIENQLLPGNKQFLQHQQQLHLLRQQQQNQEQLQQYHQHQHQLILQRNQQQEQQQQQQLQIQQQQLRYQQQQQQSLIHLQQFQSSQLNDPNRLRNPPQTEAELNHVQSNPSLLNNSETQCYTENITKYIEVSQSTTILKIYPALKPVALSAVIRTTSAWLQQFVQYYSPIAVAICGLSQQDFMAKNIAAGIATTKCRLLTSLNNNLRKALQSVLNLSQYQEAIENTAAQISSENIDFICSFIQMATVDIIIREVLEQEEQKEQEDEEEQEEEEQQED